ncbi:MFS transporter [Legionella israelensis]|nr:MFS transporter [Legionella israelensis]
MPIEKNRKYMIIAWLICGLGALFYTYEYFLRISPSVMEDALRDHFNLSATGFGFLSAFYYYAYVPMQLPVGVLMDRYGPKLLITLACMTCVIGTFMFASSSLWLAASGRFLVGLGSAFAFVGVLKLATIWLPENKLAMVSGLAAALGTIGAMIGDNVLGIFVIHLGWRQTLIITGILGAILTVILWFGLRDKKSHQRHSGTIHNFKKSMADLKLIVRNKQIWINGMFGCLVYLPTTVFAELWGIPYLKNASGMTPAAADFANSLLFLGFTVGAPIMGYLSDKLSRRKLPMFIGSMGAAIIMTCVLYLPGLSEGRMDALLFLLGIFYSVQCIVFAVGRELSPGEAAGTAMAMTNMIVMLGAMFLQPLVGRLLDISLATHLTKMDIDVGAIENLQKFYTASDYKFALTLIPLGILIGAILTFFLKETHADAPK